LPQVNPDPLDLPDALMIRPSVVAIFDSIGQEIVLATTARLGGAGAEAAYAEACARLRAVIDDLRRPLPATPERAYQPPATFESPVTREAYGVLVERAKRYIEAGDIFQVVPSHRFSAPLTVEPFAL
jgi:anthranilate synthase component 1